MILRWDKREDFELAQDYNREIYSKKYYLSPLGNMMVAMKHSQTIKLFGGIDGLKIGLGGVLSAKTSKAAGIRE